ncbi:MAG: hypothetical protein WC125_07290 [Bacteroidales bacterium]
MKKPLTILSIIVIFITGCSQNDTDLPNVKHLCNVSAYLIPYSYGLPNEKKKELWREINYNNDSTISYEYYSEGENYYLPSILSNSHLENNIYENGLLIEKYGFFFRYLYSYQNGHLASIKSYSESGLWETENFEYSGDKVVRMSETYTYSTNPTVHNYFYDTSGNLTKDSINKSSYYVITVWDYDSHNNVIKETEISHFPDENKVYSLVHSVRKYEYDSAGRIQVAMINEDYSFYFFQKGIYHYTEKGLVSQIDVYLSTNGINGTYEQKGVIMYEYNYQ